MNNVILTGRTTKNIELKYTTSGKAFTGFTLAVDKGLSKDKKKEFEENGYATADFIGCQAWGKQAETLSRFVGKGDMLGIQGSIQTGSYKDKDGKTVYTTSVLVNKIEFLNTGRNQSSNGNENSQAENDDDNFEPFDSDDSIPF